ncbi:MAG: bifunctional aspartate kinase/homoserine dehydrogenase I [Xanthomonadales bacterium]|nr:Bifunctional aspartokinase/homoserine dehydrogenase 1 [Xanthomonadales bacterium]MCC6594285.1 bifunctional aspartate kinase/homoserine dehydrogenase I [Xanthomonadales bacterium]MCE7930852.1 bifunctional aspartate kinase/homoserine dehydrogenase I [Xanthomonadales bacterium PRO6]
MRWIAHKFGGSSVANAARYQTVAKRMLARQDEAQVVVVSAMQGVTDTLIGLTALAAARNPAWPVELAALKQRHLDTAAELLAAEASAFAAVLDGSFADLEHILRSVELLGTVPVEVVELVSGLGEVWSAQMLASHFRSLGEGAVFLDAREVLRVTPTELHVAVDWLPSEKRLAEFQRAHPARRYVVTGFIARRLADERITTLGRNGSDYSASIFGALFEAVEIHIWTDVDGVLSADPRRVPEAIVLDHVTYEEAFELAYFGAKVIHPQTMAPATARNIPVFIRNTFNPEHPGTRIDADGGEEPPIKGITTIGGMALVTIEGAGMIGVHGTAERVFAALRDARISVTMISQGSSEHSICCVIQGGEADRARDVLVEAFSREIQRGQIQRVVSEKGISVLAVVGEGMAGTPGICARLFGALGRSKVNVRAIAQGSSERNISVAIAEGEATRALRAVHAGFYLSAQTVSIGIIGPGTVGQALVQQIAEARGRLKREAHLDLRVRAIATSRKMLLQEQQIDLPHWREQLAERGDVVDLDALARHVHAEHLPHAVIIDCSASSAVADQYPKWLAAGIHVLTPNKQAGGGPLARYRAVQAAAKSGRARWRYEATVGAGLPVIGTLRDLIDTGDRIERIEGIFSGTLAYLFNRFDGEAPFSELVRQAKAAGYTEPDPRDDLSGLDVARKLVILAREMGLDIEVDQVHVESLVPAELREASVEGFLAGLNCLDAPMRARFDEARANHQVLRYCAVLEADGRAEVALKALPAFHPFAHIALTDNIVSFATQRYRNNPLIVRGPGAGPDVTAAGVFADLLRVAAGLGAAL